MLRNATYWILVFINFRPPAARWFIAGLVFHPEYGGDTFLRNIGSHTDYTPEVGSILNYRCQNLWFYIRVHTSISEEDASVP
jgi:hypothetical protein